MSATVQQVASKAEVTDRVRALARGASVEISGLELDEFERARTHLWPGQRVYVSHLPRQTWERTLEVCAVVAASGFEAIPHVPVRLVSGEQELAEFLLAAWSLGVREPLLISGDYPKAKGQFSSVAQVLQAGLLEHIGFTRVSFAGHPEGHPWVNARDIHQAQVDKARIAAGKSMQVSFVTQFFFDAKPFVQWACTLRSAGIDARLVAGLAGPTRLAQLLRLATRCGVGPSMRALTRRPSSLLGLMTEHDPDRLLQELAAEWQRCAGLFDGVHFFSFGGFLRTAEWLRQRAD